METNNLGQATALFLEACDQVEWDGGTADQIVSLDPVIRSLKHLHPLEGYVCETYLPRAIGFHDYCVPYVRESSLPPMNTDAIEYDTETHTEKLPSGYFYVWDKFGYEFTPECIWELFLLYDLVLHLPKFGHANYNSVDYILQIGDLDNIIRCVDSEYHPESILGFKHKNGYSKLCKLNQDASILPKVTLLSENEANIHFAIWDYWTGLREVTVKVIQTGNTIRFGKKQIKTIVPYFGPLYII